MSIMQPFTRVHAVTALFFIILLVSSPGLILAEPDRLDINEATAKQLETLPGIGKTTAQRIIEFREAQGPFKQVKDLQRVKGIGKGKFAKIRDLITVGISTKSSSK